MDDPEAVYAKAQALNAGGRHQDALNLLADLAEGRAGQAPKGLVRRAYKKAMVIAHNSEDWYRMEALASGALARGLELAEAHRFLGVALARKARPAEARAQFEASLKLKPDQVQVRMALAQLDAAARPATRNVRPWPSKQKQFADLGHLLDLYLLRGLPEDRFIRPDSRFFTLGSCFAGNLASRLRERGYPVHWEDIGEEVNSTFANRALINWVENGPRDQPTSVMQDLYGDAARERLREAIASSDVFVMTLGVAAGFFREDTGGFAFLPMRKRATVEALLLGHVMRTTTVAENVANVGWIIDAVRRLARRPPRIVLTVSPVPLSGTSEFASAITADALSKSTLLLTAHETVSARSGDGVGYWPSFEMVRWLGAHLGAEHPPVFGAEDGSSRHVSDWLVDIIIGKFLEHHSAAPAAAS